MIPNEDPHEAIIRSTHPDVARLDAAAVGQILEGFSLVPVRSIEWIAIAIRRTLALATPYHLADGCTELDQKDLWLSSKTEWREQYRSAADATENFLVALIKNWKLFEEVLGFEDQRLLNNRLERLIDEFYGSSVVSADPPRWKQAARRQVRIDQAAYLAPVFELGFGREATVNSWPGSKGGPWPEFYQRIITAAFREARTPDLMQVLKEARTLALKLRNEFGDDVRAIFPPGTLPEYLS